MSQYEEDALCFMKRTIREAAQIQRQHFRATSLRVGEKSGGGSPVVTNADVLASQHIGEAIRTHRRGESILDEEGPKLSLVERNGMCWVIDPLDGTWLYAAGVTGSVLMAALARNGEPIVGVVYNPWTDDMFTAIKGQGAFVNDKIIRVNTAHTINESCFAIPGNQVDSLDAVGLFDDIVSQGGEVVISGSSGYDSTLVALGFAAGHVHPYTSPWDMAVIKLLVEEAGGKVTSLRGQEQRYNNDEIDGALVSNGIIHDTLLKIVGRRLTVV